MAENPYLGKELQRDLTGYLTYRFRRYRVIYTIDDDLKTVTVHLVRPRRNVYELLSELIEE
ncbi:MAG: type II toxin-antitoxin system RelE/ParE family toxin [Desulfobacterales bacterium]|nr:type II toxin-antitoxin system RelE/ParE family toxin [Desulfobacterales bacterium]